jgi:hypothetical protein
VIAQRLSALALSSSALALSSSALWVLACGVAQTCVQLRRHCVWLSASACG